jgi:hypothetical protein
VAPLQWILLIPVYGAQTLLLATIVIRANRRPTFLALWSAGVVMGLYEFYITHVLWDHPWDDEVSTGLVEVPALLIVSMVWHPIMAVILPILLTERIMVKTPTLASALPPRLRSLGPKGAWIALVLFALFVAGYYAQGAPWIAPVALSASALVVWGAVAVARRGGKVDEFADVLPTRGGVVALVACLALLFGLFIAAANGFGGDTRVSGARQVAALSLYVVFIVLTARNLRHSSEGSVALFRWVPVNGRAIVVFLAIASAGALVPWSTYFLPALFWVGGLILPLVILVRAVRGAFVRATDARPALEAAA